MVHVRVMSRTIPLSLALRSSLSISPISHVEEPRRESQPQPPSSSPMELDNSHPNPPPPGQDINQPPPEQNPNPPPPAQNLNPPPPGQNLNPPPPVQNLNPQPPGQNPNPPPPGQNPNPPPPGQNPYPPPPGQNPYPPPPGQNLNPPPPGQNPSYPPADSYPSHFQYYPAQNPNPNPVLQPNDPLYINPTLPAVAPPGVDPYSAYPNTHFSYAGAGSTVPYPHQQHYPTGHYSAADLQNWALEAVRQYGLDPTLYGGAQPATGISVAPNGTEQLATANATSTWTYPIPHPNGNTHIKLPPRKNKVLQSVYCGICKVDCNSKEVLEKHKSGKKHKKNVEKLKQSLAPALAPTPAPAPPPPPPVQNNVLPGSIDPVIGPPENPEKAKVAGKKNSKKRTAGTEDLESRKRKVLESGTAAEAVRTCHICNIVCNSDIVFSYHMAGKNHAAVVKRLLNRST